jgi:hypothetical protein
MKNKIMQAAAVLFWLASTSSSSIASECLSGDCWGAVGFGDNGRIGFAYGKKSERAAEWQVTAACRGKCTALRTFYNSCAAMARGNNWKWTWATAETREEAEQQAMRACKLRTGNCETIVWACSG